LIGLTFFVAMVSAANDSICPYEDALATAVEVRYQLGAGHSHFAPRMDRMYGVVYNVRLICETDGQDSSWCHIGGHPRTAYCKLSDNDSGDKPTHVNTLHYTDMLKQWTCGSREHEMISYMTLKCDPELNLNENIQGGVRYARDVDTQYHRFADIDACHISVGLHCYISYDPIRSLANIAIFALFMIFLFAILSCIVVCSILISDILKQKPAWRHVLSNKNS